MLRSIVTRSSKMAFSCPPELLLRNAARKNNLKFYGTSSAECYKAAVCTELGKPLSVQNMPREKDLPEGYARVKVHSAAINFGDILQTQGKYQEKPPLPFVPGSEFAGEITEVGKGVTNVAVGDRVFAVTGTGGAIAQEVICPSIVLQKYFADISYNTAASFLCSYGTAYMALTRQAKIKQGETVLVTAAAGAVGMACVDLAANIFKCRVIGACGDESKCEAVKALGAEECIVYSKEKLRDRVKELTDGKGADIIFDAVGGKVFDECIRCIAFEGRLLVIGFASGEIPKIPANLLLVKSCSAIGVYWGSYSMRYPEAFKESIEMTAKYLADGKITPHIGATFKLDKVNDAFKYILERKNVGKILINPI